MNIWLLPLSLFVLGGAANAMAQISTAASDPLVGQASAQPPVGPGDPQTPQASEPEAPGESPFVKTRDPRLWRVKAWAVLRPDFGVQLVQIDGEPVERRLYVENGLLANSTTLNGIDWFECDGDGMQGGPGFLYHEGVLAWPIVVTSSNAQLGADPAGEPAIDATVEIADITIPYQAEFIASDDGYAELVLDLEPTINERGDVRNAFLQRGVDDLNLLRLNVTWDLVSYNVSFDESRARRVSWPEGDWPAEAAYALEPDLGITYDAEGLYDEEMVRTFLEGATSGKDPKSVAPVVLAKWLAASLFETVQANGTGMRRSVGAGAALNALSSFKTRSPGQTLLEGRGSKMDLATTLVAVYRAAGLPARLLVVYDEGEADPSRAGRPFEDGRSNASAVRFLVEFALYDEESNTLGWVPVDIDQLDTRYSRIPPGFMDNPQEFFGNLSDGRFLVPLSFYLHPAGTPLPGLAEPALWSWFFDTNAAGLGRACHGVWWSVSSAPVTGDQ
ncbi:MAG: transglutaminase family protein [Planctomycetota bacterium]